MKSTILWQFLLLTALPVSLGHAATLAYTSEAFGGYLIEINLDARDWRVVGPLGISDPLSGRPVSLNGLAYDPGRNALFGINAETSSLYSVNRTSGQATLIGAYTPWQIQGLAFDSKLNALFATSSLEQRLYTIDPNTGAASLIGPTGDVWISGLAYDPVRDLLLGSTASSSSGPKGIFTIDKATGATQRLSPAMSMPPTYNGLEVDPRTNRLFGIRTDNDSLYEIDPVTFSEELVAQVRGFSLLGLAIVVPEPGTPSLLVLSAFALALHRRRRLP